MRWLAYGILGVIAYGLFLLWQLPAQTLIFQLQQRLPQWGLQVAAVEGTLWQGSAQRLQVRQRKIGSISWHWQARGLFTARWQYRLSVSEPEMELVALASIGWGGVRLQDINGRLPVPKAIALAGRPPPPLGGQLVLALQELQLSYQAKPLAVWGRIELQNLHTAFGRSLQLGDFSAVVSTAGDAMRGEIRDSGQGPLQLAARVVLRQDGRYRIEAQLGLRDDSQKDLARALSLLGRPLADGKWHFDLSGRLSL